jgi:hypothetical protein
MGLQPGEGFVGHQNAVGYANESQTRITATGPAKKFVENLKSMK